MNARDQWGGLLWLGISIFVCVESIRNDLGTFQSPGPGFLPFCVAVIMGAFSMILIVTSRLEREWKVKLTDVRKGTEWTKVLLVLVSLFLYSAILPTGGYLVTTFFLMIFLLGVMKGSRIWVQGVTALLIVLSSYVIFYLCLDIKLPKGLIGF